MEATDGTLATTRESLCSVWLLELALLPGVFVGVAEGEDAGVEEGGRVVVVGLGWKGGHCGFAF